MKMSRYTTAGLVFASMLAGTLVAVAQQVTEVPNTDSRTNPNSQGAQSDTDRRSTSTQAGQPGTSTNAAGRDLSRLDDKSPAGTIRASELMGTDIKNAKGEEIGEVKDLVIDTSGRVRYAAVKYGGILGVGSKYFAVPFAAFRVQRDPDDPNDTDDYELVLDINKGHLDGAQGFDRDHWPNFADTNFTQELDRRYNVGRTSQQPGAPPTR